MENTSASNATALQPKMHLTGKVLKTTLAGAVIDIGYKLPGVVHISQISKEPVNRVEDFLKVGQTVDVWVRRILDDRVEVTMIQPLALEWKEIQVGMKVKGKVTRIESYGVFLDIGAERPGLVHISEISHSYIKHPSEVLKEGDEVEAQVLEVDRRKRQIRLSIKAVAPKPEEILAEIKQEEAEEEKKREEQKKEEQKKNKGRKQQKEEPQPEPEEKEEIEPEVTAFQVAFQKALERSGKKIVIRPRKSRLPSADHEEILARTLKNLASK